MTNSFVALGNLRSPGVTPKDSTVWVGAWWIGFLIAALLAWIPVVQLFGLPKTIPGKLASGVLLFVSFFSGISNHCCRTLGAAKLRAGDKMEHFAGISEVKDSNTGLKRFALTLRNLLMNRTFVLLTLSTTVDCRLLIRLCCEILGH